MNRADSAASDAVGGNRAYLILGSLIIGIIVGAAARATGDGFREPALQFATVIGGLWLNALKMTVIPLVVSLMITAIARGAEAAKVGRIATRALVFFAIIYVASAIIGTLATPFFFELFPLSEASSRALRDGVTAVDAGGVAASIPTLGDFFRSIIPSNVFASAAKGEVLQLVIFALLLAFAISRLGERKRTPLILFFDGLSDALLILIGWILRVAPVGVFALAFVVGAAAGGSALYAVGHYILVVSAVGVVMLAAGYLVAILGGGVGTVAFAKAMLPSQSVAISTQSSLVSLPAMLASSRLLGIRETVADVTLPLAVALFRPTGPAMNLAVVLYIALSYGIALDPAHLIAGIAVASVMSYSSVSLPGQIGFFAAIAPIGLAMGLPVEALALFVAVETIPDIFRTLGNVTMDVAVTTTVDRSARIDAPVA